MVKIELHPAYAWDCDACGRENFVRGLVAEMSEEELADARERFGLESWEMGGFLRVPVVVVCQFCGADFETVPDDLDEDENEDVEII
jgi:hypothetical protein